MRKKLIITAAIILLLLLSFWGFLEYRQYSSYKVPVHKNAETILKINVDAFIKTFIKEYGINFQKKVKSPVGKDSSVQQNTGIYFPGNIFVYTITGKKANSFFCTLPINNLEDFKKFAAVKLGMKPESSGKLTGYDGRLSILCSGKYAAIAWSQEKEDVTPVLSDLIAGNNLLSDTSRVIKTLRKSRKHLVFATRTNSGEIEIDDDEMNISSTIQAGNDFSLPANSLKRKAAGNDIASFFINGTPAPGFFNKTYAVNDYIIETDSLLSYFNGFADLHVTGITEQADTVTTYEYDDNFEKKAIKTIVNVKVPAASLGIKTAPGIVTYLQKQRIIDSSNHINREVFPLYGLTAKHNGQTLLLTTNRQLSSPDEFENNNHFMELAIDVQKMRPLLDSTIVNKYLDGIDKISFAGTTISATTINIEGTIRFKSGVLKALEQTLEKLSK